MTKIKLILLSLCLLAFNKFCFAEPNQPADVNSINKILQELADATNSLKSYNSKIEYSFKQPILESVSLRTGEMFYKKSNGRSNLRINFKTLKQDTEKPQEYIVHYLFDGAWLTIIDFQLKQVKKYELADPNKPADAMELASGSFPIIGFENIKNLQKDFEISLLQNQSEMNLTGLHLKARPDSRYKEKYSYVNFWLDKKTNLPARMVAESTQGDIYEIKLLEPKINEPLDKNIFELEIPAGFGKPEIIPINQQ